MDINSYINLKKIGIMRNLVVLVMVLFGTVNGFAQTEVSFSDKALTVSPGDIGVVLFEGEIVVNELVLFEDAMLIFESSVDFNLLITNLKLKIGNTMSTYIPIALTSGLVDFDGTFYADSAISVTITADFRSDISGKQSFVLSDLDASSWDRLEYVNSGLPVTINPGHISHTPVRIDGDASVLTIVRTDVLVDRDVLEGTQDELMLSLQVYNEGNSYDISQLEFTAFGYNSSNFNDNVTATLYLDGSPIRTTVLSDGVITFTNLSIEFYETSDLDIYFDISYGVSANDELLLEMTEVLDGSSTVVDVPVVTSATITIVEEAVVVSMSPNANESMFFPAGAVSCQLIDFNISALNGDIKLTDLFLHNSLTLDIANRFHTIELYDIEDYNTPIAMATTVLSNGIAFEGMDEDIIIPAGITKTFVVSVSIYSVDNVADLENQDLIQFYVSDEDFTVPAGTVDGIRFISMTTGGTITNVLTSNPISNEHRVVKNIPIFELLDFDASFAESNNNVMKFAVTAIGTGSLSLEDLEFNLTGITEGTIKIYQDAVIPANLIGTADCNDPVVLLNSVELDAGMTEEFYVMIENVVGSGERIFELDVVNYNSIFADGEIIIDGGDYSGTNLPISNTYDQGTTPVKSIGNGDGYTKFVVYPNPVSSILNISNFENADHAELYDMFGKKVMDIRESQIDVSSLINGVYIIKFVDSDSRILESMSIVKQGR